jgi:uncharacterized protein YecT (DUF1311 family)
LNSNRRDFVAEIQARRSRGHPASSLALLRLAYLRRALEIAKQDQELLRYFPIAIIAATEGFFRTAIAELIDSDSARLTRLLESPLGKNQKFDLSVLGAVGGKLVSVGDLVAHLLPISRLSHINSHMSTVLGSDFIKELRQVHNRADVELHGKPKKPIIKNMKRVLASMEQAFEYRHIFAHEAAGRPTLDPVEVTALLDAATPFLSAADELVGNTINPNYPLTQYDMNQEAAARFRSADAELTTLYDEWAASKTKRTRALKRAQQAWLRFRKAHGEFAYLEAEGGTIAPLLASSAMAEVTRERIKHLRNLLNPEEGAA